MKLRALCAASVLLLLAAGVLVQVYFLQNYPQPILFGDPGAYYVVGQKLQQAVARIYRGESPAAVWESVRGLVYFAGVGLLYGAMDALRPGDIRFFRLLLGGFNTLGMLGCFFLARHLSGSAAGGLIALALAAVYPSFSVQTGRLFPEPVVGCLFVWAAFFYLEGLRRSSLRWMAAAGLALTAGLFVRAQVMTYTLYLLALAGIGSAPAWLRSRKLRRLSGAFVLGCLPLVLLWSFIVMSAAHDFREIERFGFFAFPQQQRYPYGFWQFLDSDGWIGPYPLQRYPFYRMLEVEAQKDPGLLSSRLRQIAFTARYVVSRPWESALLVLDNIYRLYDRPANDYKWDYPFPDRYQVIWQRLIVIFAVAGMAVFFLQRPASVGIFSIPAALAVLHGLSFPMSRYNQTAMLILIGVAAGFIDWAARRLRSLAQLRNRAGLALGAGAGLGLILFVAGEGLRQSLPELARASRWAAAAVSLALPFLLPALLPPSSRRRSLLPGLAWAGVVLVVSAHFLRDRRWHEAPIVLGQEISGVEQEIFLSGESVAKLRGASEVFLVSDLRLPEGNPDRIRVEVNGKIFPGSRLTPTMPRLGGATVSGGRDPRGFPQWWALPIEPGILPRSAPAFLRVRLMVEGGPAVVLLADRFHQQSRWYEGPSFGDWPHLAITKLQYDGDYRLPVRLPLESEKTTSFLLSRGGQRLPLRSLLRIRFISLKSNEGHLDWESAPLPPARRLALGFFGFSGASGQADLLVGGRVALRFPLGSAQDFEVQAPPYRLCYRAEPRRGEMAYGGYLLFAPGAEPGKPLPLSVRFRSGMSADPMFFSIDLRRNQDDLSRLFARCGAPSEAALTGGASRLVDASANSYPEDRGSWAVAGVF